MKEDRRVYPAGNHVGDGVPAAQLTSSGGFFGCRQALMRLVRHAQERESSEQLLERMMGIEEVKQQAFAVTE